VDVDTVLDIEANNLIPVVNYKFSPLYGFRVLIGQET
jgi:hypothetical protein